MTTINVVMLGGSLIIKGRAEGRAEGKAEVAVRMLDAGMEVSMIAQLTQLSVEEIEALKK